MSEFLFDNYSLVILQTHPCQLISIQRQIPGCPL